MFNRKFLMDIILLLLIIPVSEIQPQLPNLIITDTTITTTVTFTHPVSISAGPNFIIASTGDASLITGGQIYLRTGVSVALGGILKAVLDSTLVGVEIWESDVLPTEFSLHQNYPNPFNPTTSIRYAIISQEFVSLKVYDLLGNEVAVLINEEKPAGEYEVNFDGTHLPSGVYFYRLQAGTFTETKKLVLLR